ncbi:MAG: gfo/Idh/MocA family oxidoreductase, partial [Clostridiales bacterium]|nr:gfo/Idh/MocA family oxidoreductase [Clostridiales bacterium]
PYGRCVYQCDNNVVDHQVVNLEFKNNVTVAFTMCAFTKNNERVFRFMGTRGEIEAYMEKNEIILKDFVTGNINKIEVSRSVSGHGGGDSSIMGTLGDAIRGKGEDKSSAVVSVQSHMMAFAAEKSRLENRVIDLDEYVSQVAEKAKQAFK